MIPTIFKKQPYTASGDIGPYKAVVAVDDATVQQAVDATTSIQGVSQGAAMPDGLSLEIVTLGIVPMIAADDITAGDKIIPDANGDALPVTAETGTLNLIGVAYEDAAAGEYCAVRVSPMQVVVGGTANALADPTSLPASGVLKSLFGVLALLMGETGLSIADEGGAVSLSFVPATKQVLIAAQGPTAFAGIRLYGDNVTLNGKNFPVGAIDFATMEGVTNVLGLAIQNFTGRPNAWGLTHVPGSVANLPAASVGDLGRVECVNDATAPVVGAAVVGGGSATALVWCNGAAWNVVAV